ncbi:hypothetical protein HDU81_008630 [Chytriomyces hyalinus]|nr:hypothetical protein HDU81_008630 [Chytriomyces hyalinus]
MEIQTPIPKYETPTPIIHTTEAASEIEILFPTTTAPKPPKEKLIVNDENSMLNVLVPPAGGRPSQRLNEAINVSKAAEKSRLTFEIVDPRVWSVNETAGWTGTIVAVEDRARVYQAVIDENITGEIFKDMSRDEVCAKLGLAWGDAVKLQEAFNVHLARFLGDGLLPPPEYQEMA